MAAPGLKVQWAALMKQNEAGLRAGPVARGEAAVAPFPGVHLARGLLVRSIRHCNWNKTLYRQPVPVYDGLISGSRGSGNWP